MTKRIQWKCTLGSRWEWISVKKPIIGIPQHKTDTYLNGTIELTPNKDYWHSCARLVLQNVTFGEAMLPCWSNDGGKTYVVEVRTVAEGKWENYGTPGNTSSTTASGGINLEATIS